MKFPYTMLLDFVETRLNADQIGDLLTMAGFELEGIEEVEGEPVLDIKVVSNRGDGLSVFGLAREVLAKDLASKPTDLYNRAAKRFAGGKGEGKNPATVEIQTEDCTRYACRYYETIPKGDSPEWMQSRLRRAGMRPISFAVDATNYILLELGQPLHAFDYENLACGKIVVRKAKPGEKLATLDGGEHELRPDQMMICDAEKPVAAAGIMGGETSEVTESTKHVLLESAHFVNTSIRRTRKQLGLNTEASYRFERSVDPAGVIAAIERFSELLGIAGSEIVDVYPSPVSYEPVKVRVDRAVKLLGMEIRPEQAKEYLQRLGMEVSGEGDPFLVTPPTWRPDIVREEDLIEELGRVHGFERIPEWQPFGTTTLGGPQGTHLEVDRVREEFVRLGYIQIVSHSLRDKHPLDAVGERVGPRSPGSPDMAWLRNSLLTSLADAAQRNGGRDLHLFEVGKVFDAKLGERRMAAALSTGSLVPENRKGEVLPQADFFALKGTVEDVFGVVFADLELVPESADTRFHPTRQAALKAHGQTVGVLGQIHPEIANELNLPATTVLTEFDLDLLLAQPADELKLKPLSRHPAVRRDIALLVDKSVPYAQIEGKIVEAGGDVLEKHWLFDVYAGANLPEGKHSLGIALQLRKMGETFTDEEANRVRETVVSALAELGATTR